MLIVVDAKCIHCRGRGYRVSSTSATGRRVCIRCKGTTIRKREFSNVEKISLNTKENIVSFSYIKNTSGILFQRNPIKIEGFKEPKNRESNYLKGVTFFSTNSLEEIGRSE